jgi:hypothetical protein
MATRGQLMAIFHNLGFDQKQRHEFIYAWTGGRTQSSKELLSIEIDEICSKMQSDFKFNSQFDAHIKIEKKQKRSIVLTIATRVGIHDPNNWSKFNGFMLKSSIYKKPLNKYDLDELDALIKQFRGLEANYNKSANKTGTKAWRHKHGMSDISLN